MPRNDDLGRTPATRDTPDYSQYLPAAHPAGWTGPYGAAYNVPDPRWAAEMARVYNEQALPFLMNTANDYNQFNYDQRMGQVMGTPGFSGVQSNLAGMVPNDVLRELQLGAAQRGVAGGFIPDLDNPNTNAAYLRALGLTSLDQQKLGQQQLNALLSQFQQAAPFNLMSGMIDQDTMGAALLQAAVNAGLPNPKEAADEAQRKLLEAIEAGKAAAAGPGGPVGGGIDVQKIIDAFKSASGGNQGPGTAVGRGPNQTVDRGNNFFVPSPVTPFKWTDPGVSGTATPGYNTQGIRNDVIRNAIAPTTYANYPIQGMGLDPSLNAVLQSLGNTGIQYGGGPTIENAYANFGSPNNYLSPTYGDPWNNDPTIGATNPSTNWLGASDPVSAMMNIDWAQPYTDYVINPSDLGRYMSGEIDLPQPGPFANAAPWAPDYGDILGIGDIGSGGLSDDDVLWWLQQGGDEDLYGG